MLDLSCAFGKCFLRVWGMASVGTADTERVTRPWGLRKTSVWDRALRIYAVRNGCAWIGISEAIGVLISPVLSTLGLGISFGYFYWYGT